VLAADRNLEAVVRARYGDDPGPLRTKVAELARRAGGLDAAVGFAAWQPLRLTTVADEDDDGGDRWCDTPWGAVTARDNSRGPRRGNAEAP
jgi:hypothetical protein